MDSFKSERALALSFSASIALVLTYLYFFRVEILNFNNRINLETNILEHSAESPYRYRILIPTISSLIMRGIQRFVSYQDSFYLSHIIINFLVIFSYILITYYLLRVFFGVSVSLIGLYILGFSIVITLQDHVYQPWSLLESMLWAMTFYLIVKQKLIWLPVLTVVASANRETGIFIPIIILLLSGYILKSTKFKISFILLNFLLSLQIFVGLRVTLGATYENFNLLDVLDRNLQQKNIFLLIINLTLLFGFNWFFAVKNSNANIFWRKSFNVIYIYIPFVFLFGVWYEVRLLLPVLIIFLAFILSKIEIIVIGSERTQL